MNFYKVLFPIAVKDGFIYSSDVEIEIGSRVIVPFRGKHKIGVVWDKTDENRNYEIKPVLDVPDKQPIIDAKLKKTVEFIARYYLTFIGLVLKSALPKRIFEVHSEIDLAEKNCTAFNFSKGHNLNQEQQHIYDNINQNEFGVNLIFGVTGSGKTEVYMRVMEDVLKKGKKCVVLVPEIVLTPQYIDVFSKRFSSDILSIVHSRLTPKKRFDNWLNFKKGKTRILIGTRSAVFSDFENLGVVVVDEENDESYKQENEPRYNAKDVAIFRAKQHNIPVILCSATPTLESYHKAVNGKFKLFRLKKRIKNIPLPSVDIVETNKNEILPDYTINKIESTLKQKKTVAVLVNRRGFSNYLVCADCGYLFVCPNCSVSLTYHKKTNDLKCHWCEASYDIPSVCPKCGSANIMSRGVGSQQVEEILKRTFPKHDTERFDRDSVLTKKEFERIVGKLQDGKIDILIGTQMLSKGHDISKIGLVVVASLEELFGVPDFRAREKALSLVIQTAGRSGRAELGNVIVQTVSKDSELIKYIKTHNYEDFLKEEIKTRMLLKYPPFNRLIRIIIESTNKNSSRETADKIALLIKDELDILGPAKCPVYKLRNKYRYHILVKTSTILKATGLIDKKVREFKEKVHFDVDPISFF